MNRQINQEAADWFVEVNTDVPDLETRRRFDKWLRASPQHVRAFLEMVPIWEDGGRVPLSSDATPEQLIERAQAAVSVVGLQGAVPSPVARPYSRFSGRFARAAAALATVVVLVVIVLGYQQLRYPVYTTGLGEQRSLALPDGSMLELNTLSRVRVRYSGRERAVELLSGQALLDVVKNPARPFVVYSGQTRIRAVGTQFDVYRQPVDTLVTVVEGRVAVYDAAMRSGNDSAAGLAVPGSMLVAAGEQLRVTAHAADRVEHPNMGLATAWTQHQMVFDDTPLTDVAQEFDRYNKRRLIIDGAQLREFRVSGIFSSTDPSSLIRFLREQPGISVEEADDQVHISGNGVNR
jgi:transmembrane sensor